MTQIEVTPSASLTGKWKPYPDYKDSGVEWLGKIPEHWELSVIKRYLVSLKDGTHGTFERVLEGVPFLSAKNVANGKIEISNHESLISYADYEAINQNGYLKLGDLLLTIVGTIGRTAIFSWPEPVAFQRSVAVLRFRDNQNVCYFYYLIRSQYFQTHLLTRAKESAQSGVYLSDVSLLPVLSPPLPEQRNIASFLDRQTTRINTLIEKKKRLIELLQEKRAALISHAVTKGLDSTVQMKDSGVERLGEIPVHWEVKRLKFCLYSIEQGWSPTCENRPAELDEWGVLKVGCVNGIKFNPDENKALPAETQPIHELEIKQGDVLVSRANTRELLGSASEVTNVRPHLLLCDKLYRLKIRTDTVNSVYLVMAMGSNIMRFQLECDATGASNSMQNISQGTILNLAIPLPNMLEQQAIVSYLDRETAKIDALVSRIREGIEKLKEYSSALISAAVTGKIDVRGETALQIDE